MSGWYELSKNAQGEFWFVLKADNSEIILTSQMYTTKAAAETGIASVQTNSTSDANYEKKDSTSGQPYFVLKAANLQVIGTSQMYSTTAARDAGIASVKVNGPSKTVKQAS